MWRAPATTWAPSPARARVMASPMPLLAPVTTAAFPVRCRSMTMSSRGPADPAPESTYAGVGRACSGQAGEQAMGELGRVLLVDPVAGVRDHGAGHVVRVALDLGLLGLAEAVAGADGQDRHGELGLGVPGVVGDVGGERPEPGEARPQMGVVAQV